MKDFSEKNADGAGTLYLVATPIGNLEDLTYRAARVLREVDYVYCEDTRRTLTLLRHYGIERPSGIDSYHDHSPARVLEKIRDVLKNGKSVAYATDGGVPVVSDPGFVLVRAAHQSGARVVVLPGPSAAVTLFAASGLASPKYLFHGFFPRTRGEVEKTIEVVKSLPVVHLFYEAPGRVGTSFEILGRNLPENEAVIGRELTKLHEEVLRGTALELHEALEARGKVKGECVIAVLGGDGIAQRRERERSGERAKRAGTASTPMVTFEEQLSEPVLLGKNVEVSSHSIELTPQQREEISTLIKSGVSSKDAAKQLSKKFKMSRRVIYEFIIRHLT